MTSILSQLLTAVETAAGIDKGQLFGNRIRTRQYSDARKIFVLLADRAGQSNADVVKFTGFDRSSVRTMRLEGENLFLVDKQFHALLKKAERLSELFDEDVAAVSEGEPDDLINSIFEIQKSLQRLKIQLLKLTKGA